MDLWVAGRCTTADPNLLDIVRGLRPDVITIEVEPLGPAAGQVLQALVAARPEARVVVLSADHGVAPIPEDLKAAGLRAGWLNPKEIAAQVEKTLKLFNYPSPAIAGTSDANIYFAPGIYGKLKAEPAALDSVLETIKHMPGVANVFRAEEVAGQPETQDPMRRAESDSYFTGRSGDLIVVPEPYWSWGSGAKDGMRSNAAMHGSPYYYDQRVPILLMGYGIQPGTYYAPVTPADIAPTLAALCGITLPSPDGRILSEALSKPQH